MQVLFEFDIVLLVIGNFVMLMVLYFFLDDIELQDDKNYEKKLYYWELEYDFDLIQQDFDLIQQDSDQIEYNYD